MSARAALLNTTTSDRLDFAAFGAGLAVTLVALFVTCDVAAVAFPELVAPHGWVELFTAAPVGSFRSFVDGTLWSVAFGWGAALTFVPIYNRIGARKAQT